MHLPRPTTDASTFRFLRSETGEIVRMFSRHEHDRNWTPVSDHEAYDYFLRVGANLEALDLAYIGQLPRSEPTADPAPAAKPPRRKSGVMVPAAASTVPATDANADLIARGESDVGVVDEFFDEA